MSRKSFYFIIVFWTLFVLSSFFYYSFIEKGEKTYIVKSITRSFFEEIISVRHWNALHGGVYVPVTPETQPNPYLDDPLRDVTTTGGLKLTKINPEYMTRQLSKLNIKENGIKYHITSLITIDPKNKPDEWETNALKSFDNGEKEVFELVNNGSRKIFRFMAPLYVDTNCLSCHEKQGYKIGQVRGGISVNINAQPFLSSTTNDILRLAIVNFIIWIIGMGGILFYKTRLDRQYKIINDKNSELEKEIIIKIDAEKSKAKLIEELNESKSTITEEANKLYKLNEQLLDTAEKLRKSNVIKDKFFSIIAHDLRNPIGSLKSLNELLVVEFKKYTDDEKFELIDMMRQTTNQVYDLLVNLLTWSRTQSGSITYNPENTDISYIVNNIKEISLINLLNKKIQLTSNIRFNTYVFADVNMVTTIFRNLISNAIKFTPNGGKISVSSEEKGNFYEFSVSDTGVGIPKEDQDKLFRTDISYTTPGTQNERGTGLGLILCKEFIEKHGGIIWIVSDKDKGSTFKFTLPKALN